MPAKRKSWRDKLHHDKGFPKVFPIDATKSPRWGNGTFVIPAPREVDQLMRRVPRGKLTTIDEMRKVLARRHRATIACPVTTGIFAWIAAHAAAESNSKSATAYWRTLKSDGQINPKYPGGLRALSQKLRAEGHTLQRKGKRLLVREFANHLATLGN